jgi:hypothetical protein
MNISGTGFFFRKQETLLRAISIQLPEPYSGQASVEVNTGLEQRRITQVFAEGQALVPAVTTFDRPVDIEVTVTCPQGAWTAQASLPPTRPWTIYIAQDKHLDFGWIHPVEGVVERINRLTDFALQEARSSGFHWNFDTSIWFEEYLKARSSGSANELVEALRSGQFEMAACNLVPFPGYMSMEEILQSLMPAQRISDSYGIPVRTVSLQEVPSLPWGMISILAGAGIPYLVKGAYSLRNPHLKERQAYPLAWWEGPDGQRMLVKWDGYEDTNTWGGYAEAYKLWRAKSTQERLQFIQDTLKRYDDLSADYPVSAILLAGTGHDEYPLNRQVADFIAWFNTQGWEYPKLVDSTWSMFWQAVESQLEKRPDALPVTRGDLGSTWEEWPAQLAHLSVTSRQVRETTLAAQAAAACALPFDPQTHSIRKIALDAAWRGLITHADHNIGGNTPAMADDMRDRKAAYVYNAGRESAAALESGLAVLASRICLPQEFLPDLLVFNSLGWETSPLVRVMVPEGGEYRVEDLDYGRTIPNELETSGPWHEHYLSFVATGLPAFGYRCFSLKKSSSEQVLTEVPAPAEADWTIQNQAFCLKVDPITGAVRSFCGLKQQAELENSTSRYGINQFLHHSDRVLSTTTLQKVTKTISPLASRLVVEMRFPQGSLRSTYTLYPDLPYLDISNEIERPASHEPQCSWFAFPFAVEPGRDLPGGAYFYDSPGAILHAGAIEDGGDQIPGAGMTCFCVQSFLAVQGAQAHAVLASPDAHLFQFGEHILLTPLADSRPRSPLALSNVMNNFTRNDHATNQGGQTRFTFRYRLGCASGPISPDAALRFAGSFARPAGAAWLSAANPLSIVAPTPQSFLSVSPANVIATTFKAADNGQGWVLRLWEVNGKGTQATIDVRALAPKHAYRCDLLERVKESLDLQDGLVRLDIPARGLAAIRFA